MTVFILSWATSLFEQSGHCMHDCIEVSTFLTVVSVDLVNINVVVVVVFILIIITLY